MRPRQRNLVLGVLAFVLVSLWLLGSVLTPFLIGAGLAYVCDPIVDRLEAMRLSRTGGVIVVFAVVVVVLSLLMLLLLPQLQQQHHLQQQQQAFPYYVFF